MDTQFWLNNMESLPHQIFLLVMGGLYGLAYLLGTTYKVVNILVYFLIIPSSYLYLISKKTTKWINLVSLVAFCAYFLHPNFEVFNNHLFDESVVFLNGLASIFNSNYIDMSVYFCVVLLVLIYVILIPLTCSKKFNKIFFISLLLFIGMYYLLVFPNLKSILISNLP